MAKVYHGIGIDDSGKRNVRYKGKSQVWVNPCFQRWKSMIKRCYAPSSVADNCYAGTAVCGEWLSFSAFEKWMLSKEWEDKDMDKDYLSLTSKVYSPDTCAFIPKEVNYFIGSSPGQRGQLPLGVSYSKERDRYSSHVRVGGKSVGLGRYKAAGEAHRAYQVAKLEAGRAMLDKHRPTLDERVTASILVILEKMADDIEGGRETKSLHPITLPETYKRKLAEQLKAIQ